MNLLLVPDAVVFHDVLVAVVVDFVVLEVLGVVRVARRRRRRGSAGDDVPLEHSNRVPRDVRDRTTLLDRLEVQETVAGSASLPRRVVLEDGTPRRFHLRWTTFLVLYGDLAKELRAFVDVADAWLETLPNRPRKLTRDESGAEADEDLDDEGAA